MFESDVRWIEALTQISIVVPFCFLMEKSVGYKRFRNRIPGRIPAAILYTIWNLYNIIVIHYPEVLEEILPITAAYRIRAVLGLTMMFLVIPSFYRGTIVERYFACFVIEAISILGGLFRYVCILVVKSNGMYDNLAQNVWLLLAFRLLIENAPYFLCYFLMKKQFEHYHENVLSHKKICCLSTIVVITLETLTAFLTISKDFQDMIRWTLGSIFIFVVIGAVIILLKRENGRIRLQKQLMENHYQLVKNQEEKIAGMRSEIQKLLVSAETLEKKTESIKTDFKYYEDELKKLHRQLQREEYIDDLMLDALLHNKMSECKEKQIDLEIEMQDMKPEKIADIDLFEILYTMFEIAIGQAELKDDGELKHITVHGKNLAGQAVIEISFPFAAKQTGVWEDTYKKHIRTLKRKVKLLKGQCVLQTEENRKKIVAGIPCA